MEIIETVITNVKDVNSVAAAVAQLAETKQDKLQAAITADIAVGHVAVGKTWPAGTSLETILRDILEA